MTNPKNPREWWFAEADEYLIDEPDKCGLKRFVEYVAIDELRRENESLKNHYEKRIDELKALNAQAEAQIESLRMINISTNEKLQTKLEEAKHEIELLKLGLLGN